MLLCFPEFKVSAKLREFGMSNAHYSPEYTFKLHYEVRIFALMTVLPNELSEFSKMALLEQDLASKFCFRHLAVKMGRNGTLKLT